MSGWSTVPLDEVARVFNGKTPAKYEQRDEGHPVLKIKDVSSHGRFRECFNSFVEPALAEKHSTKMIQAGDILILNAAHNADYVGSKTYRAEPATYGALATGEWLVIRSSERLSASFVYHWVTSQGTRQRIRELVNGIHLYPKDVARLRIPLPSLPEQRRIATILDKADALRTKRRQALAQIDRLGQSIFVEMFGDPMSPSAPWKSVPISSFVAGFESGKSVAADDEEDSSSRYRVLKVSAVTSLEFKPSESKAAPHDHIPQDSHFVRAGDLLFSRANTTELIGATAYVVDTPDNLLLPDKLWRFIWHEAPRATPHFVNFLFRQPKFRAEIGRRSSGSSGSMKNISQQKVLSIEVALPPFSLQEEFSKRIEKVMQIKASQTPAVEAINSIFASLQHRAFRGEI